MIYRTREERREAGREHEIAPWLTLSGLLELEFWHDDYRLLAPPGRVSDHESTANLQLGFLADLFGFAELEVEMEYDTGDGKWLTEEAYAVFESDPWEFTLGRQYTPLGIYYSSFVTGSPVEFAETRAREMLGISYGPSDELDITLAWYRGRAQRAGSSEGRRDWALGVEGMVDNWRLGASFQSDLADADSGLLDDFDGRYARRVPAVGAYLVWVGESFEVAAEAIVATRAFAELDADRDRPRAWNIEIVGSLPAACCDLALRLAGSRELEDEPRLQVGPALTWRVGRFTAVTLEYLRAEYARGLAATDDDRDIDHVDRLAARLSIAF